MPSRNTNSIPPSNGVSRWHWSCPSLRINGEIAFLGFITAPFMDTGRTVSTDATVFYYVGSETISKLKGTNK